MVLPSGVKATPARTTSATGEPAAAGLDEAVDHEPHHGHGAEGDRVHDPAAFDEEVGEGLVVDPGGRGFLGRGGEGQQAQEGGAEEGGTEVHLHDDGVVWVDR